jgi:hypothetical protein
MNSRGGLGAGGDEVREFFHAMSEVKPYFRIRV